MSVIIQLNESNASRRVVPLPPLVQSNGTSACTNESGRTFYFSVGGVDYGSGGSISAISAAMGLYECLFSASKVSAMGQGRVYYGGVNSSSTAMVASTPIEIVQFNSYDSMRMGLFALPNAAAEAAGGLVTFGTGTGQLHTSGGSVGLKAQTHSQATIGGINNILAGTYSGVSVEIKSGGIQTTSIGAGNYSGVSVEIKTKGIGTNSITSGLYSAVSVRVEGGDYSSVVTVGVGNIAAGNYSGVTIQGVSNTSSSVDLISAITGGVWYAATHSGVTIDGVNRINSSVTPANATYSAVTVRIDGVSYSGATIDGVRFLSLAGERSAASSLLSTSLGGTTPRLVQQALELLRNKVILSGSTMTVMKADDTTSSWTATISTGTATVYGVAPGIA